MKTKDQVIPEIAGDLLALAGGKTKPPQSPGVIYYNLAELLAGLLEEIERQAITLELDPDHPEKYLDMLESLRDRITDRIIRY